MRRSTIPTNVTNAAQATRRKLVDLNRLWQAEAAYQVFLPVRIGIGINTGECVVGNFGSHQHFDYSLLGDTVPVEIVDGGEEAGRGEPEVVEQAQRRCPVLPSVSSQQRGVLVNKLVLDNPLRRQRIDTARLSLALNRYEIHLDQSRIAEASSCLLADHQIDAIDLAGPSSREARFTGSPSSE